jgi:hypothetical protein
MEKELVSWGSDVSDYSGCSRLTVKDLLSPLILAKWKVFCFWAFVVWWPPRSHPQSTLNPFTLLTFLEWRYFCVFDGWWISLDIEMYSCTSTSPERQNVWHSLFLILTSSSHIWGGILANSSQHHLAVLTTVCFSFIILSHVREAMKPLWTLQILMSGFALLPFLLMRTLYLWLAAFIPLLLRSSSFVRYVTFSC